MQILSMRKLCCSVLVLAGVLASMRVDAAEPIVTKYLTSGRLADGEKALTAHLANQPQDGEARLGLGMLQFLQAVEHLGQSWYKYGALSDRNLNVPFFRMPIPENPEPAEITYDDVRAVVQGLVDRLAEAEKTLGEVTSADVKLPVRFALVRLDIDGDGTATDDEALWRIFARVASGPTGVGRGFNNPEEFRRQAEAFQIAFDQGDVHWLRGYCHLLMALCEIGLAHDGQAMFDSTAQLFFDNPKTPHEFLKRTAPREANRQMFSLARISDVIAYFHLFRLEVIEPERMKSAHAHLREVIAQSRLSWKAILAEEDNDREWIPNPKQETVIPGIGVTPEMVADWQKFLDEGDDLLTGKKLVPFWRGDRSYGVNLRKVFEEPRTLDPVLWIQGTAAAPYLEQGELSAPETWQQLQRTFGGNFWGFALWFN